ncbi:J domain-containing protein [Candidatus Paracaedibacter symbiosus]|uniref:J domain-containing protein n=1 Tax=Candidatus Paracaedibacter symbiosus TaxID=244582 RepID=UPI0012EC2D43|nr:J domain-containing protein [Candidatus Paracaedibacter symbiosus]
MFRKFTQWFDNPPPKNAPDNHPCDYQNCVERGIYRAPKSRHQLDKGVNDWHWLCLGHVRDYNSSWNYYTNMSETEIVNERQSDITWDRPTWSLGDQPQNKIFQYKFEDPFGFFESQPKNNSVNNTINPNQDALDLLGLRIPFTREQLQKNYRQLVKKYHPDTNRDNPEAEEMIRRLNQAYSRLQKMGEEGFL